MICISSLVQLLNIKNNTVMSINVAKVKNVL